MGAVEWFHEGQRLQQGQRFAEAEGMFRRVVEADPKHIGGWLHLGLVCLAQEKLPAAGEAFGRALALAPDHVDALTHLGIIFAMQRRLPEAVQKLRRAIELKPGHAKAHNNLGVALTQLGRFDEGMACYREAARLQPDYAEAHFNLGVGLAERRQNLEAIASYERALDARADYPEVLYNLGMALVNERRSAEAVVYLEQAVRLRPDNPDAHNNLSLALADLGRFEDAVASSDAALRLRPLDAKSHMNRGNALCSLGRIDEAVACYGLALRLDPNYTNARWNRALAWLTQGDYERGWPEYEWRLKKAETRTRNFPEPRWDGSTLQGKTILLWCEQGLGDTLQFVRFAVLLKERGATVWVECPAKMMAILGRCAGVDRVLPEGTPLPAGFDCEAPLMSLPYLFGTTLRDVPAPIPYVSADPALAERWREEIPWGRSPTRLERRQEGQVGDLPHGNGDGQLGDLPHGNGDGQVGDLAHGNGNGDGQVGDLPRTEIITRSVMTTLDDATAREPDTFEWKPTEDNVSDYTSGQAGSLSYSAFKIGVAWQGNPKHRFDRHRSFPLHWFHDLARMEGVELFSLQKGPGSEDLKTARFPIVDLGSKLDEGGDAFAETAAVIAALDLVITCDSALAHLAGALGTQVWVALSVSADWRWLLDRGDTPWYPSMRLFRQTKLGQWAPVFERIREEVKQRRDQSSPVSQYEYRA